MLRFRITPREGHMEAVLQIFGYVKGHLQSQLDFDPGSLQGLGGLQLIGMTMVLIGKNSTGTLMLMSYVSTKGTRGSLGMRYRSTSLVMLNMRPALLLTDQRRQGYV